ncbi:sterile alpha motif domain-containing protein 3-like [Haemaphysalis longicornis]
MPSVSFSPGVSSSHEATPSTSSACRRSTASYRFPELPFDIKARINDVKDGRVPRNLRKRIIEFLWFDLAKYDMYPDRLYDEVAMELVNRYPQLEDATDPKNR